MDTVYIYGFKCFVKLDKADSTFQTAHHQKPLKSSHWANVPVRDYYSLGHFCKALKSVTLDT